MIYFPALGLLSLSTFITDDTSIEKKNHLIKKGRISVNDATSGV